MERYGQKLDTSSTRDDPMIAPATREALGEVARSVKAGGGVRILFCGPPGKGRTTAARVLSSELGAPVYRTHLGQSWSKYIGETEKNLSRVFEHAEKSGSILLFDEADAILGSRTGVRDSHDRYGNVETSYLLQRMESHRGVVILATNSRDRLDPALVRRFDYVIDLAKPIEPDLSRRVR